MCSDIRRGFDLLIAGIALRTLAEAASRLAIKFGETSCLSDAKDFCFHMTAVVPIKTRQNTGMRL